MATATTRTSEIVIEDVGPVDRVVIPYPEGGGVVELRGRNGAGKSTSLAAIQAALSGEGARDLTVRRGAPKGTVEAFGLTLRLGARTTTKGELEVESIESQLDLSRFVDPGIQDEAKADSRRLKEAVGLVEMPPAELLRRLAKLLPDGKFAEVTQGISAENCGDDLLAIADRVKRRLDSEALLLERAGEELLGKAKVLTERIEGIDLSAPSDSEKLQADVEDAVRELARLNEQAANAAKSEEARKQAEALLARYEGDDKAPTVDMAKVTLSACDAECEAIAEAVRQAHEALMNAQRQQAVAKERRTAAIDALADAERRRDMIAKFRAQLGVPVVSPPEPGAIGAAAAVVESKKAALERGQSVRDAIEDSKKAAKARDAAKEKLAAGNVLREAARGIDSVLSDVVRESGLDVTVRGDRLYLGQKLFGELSHGERWRAVLAMAAKCSKRGGVFHLPQEAWEGLQPRVKRDVATWAKELGLVIYTARASDDEQIVAEVL